MVNPEPDYGPLFGCLVYAGALAVMGLVIVAAFALGALIQSWLT